ncbi:hypothetical protein ACFHWD_14445 [Clostridium sp. MT-14]|jgi:hypothetical protein|uniref:hypothetical protein n=1 Tax=unclassified Clostridium TaxID=2614128 RepID=UPI001239A920|nr:hypothetical protein [Clostridium sp. HV4-5-A1G]KAA8676175.1 hypothetical protein F3O63_03625 [Clostridium sp. HV4-5-A1G]
MANPAFTALINSFNAQLAAMNKNDFKMYDPGDCGYFIDSIYYDSDKDKIMCKFKEDFEGDDE